MASWAGVGYVPRGTKILAVVSPRTVENIAADLNCSVLCRLK